MKDTSEIGLDDLIIGSPIAKGCSAVVYAAALKENHQNESTSGLNDSVEYDSDTSSNISIEHLSPTLSPNRFAHNFGSSLENPHFLQHQNIAQPETRRQPGKRPQKVQFNSKPVMYNPSRTDIVSSSESIRSSIENIAFASNEQENSDTSDIKSYPLAMKMMFNYDIQSNAISILRAMYKETIPAINKYNNADADGWEKLLMEQTAQLPPHPNIVLMVGVFCAQVPNLMQSTSLYPMALPQRLNPNGYGRNMSLFLLMKRYEYSLCEYLKSSPEISMRTRLLLFAQLLEGVAHLYRY